MTLDPNDVLPKLDDNDLIGEFDATVWAERFVLRATERPQIATSMGAMTAWFAAAIMTGYDRPRDSWVCPACGMNYPDHGDHPDRP